MTIIIVMDMFFFKDVDADVVHDGDDYRHDDDNSITDADNDEITLKMI
jgi:hypothetical protein